EELFREGGFSQIETRTVKHTFVLPSFDAYYGPFERGGASTGQALSALPEEIRRAVRDEVRRDFGDTSGPIEVEAGDRIASGRSWAPTHAPVPAAARIWPPPASGSESGPLLAAKSNRGLRQQVCGKFTLRSPNTQVPATRRQNITTKIRNKYAKRLMIAEKNAIHFVFFDHGAALDKKYEQFAKQIQR